RDRVRRRRDHPYREQLQVHDRVVRPAGAEYGLDAADLLDRRLFPGAGARQEGVVIQRCHPGRAPPREARNLGAKSRDPFLWPQVSKENWIPALAQARSAGMTDWLIASLNCWTISPAPEPGDNNSVGGKSCGVA